VPVCSLHEMLVRESHSGGMMGHFGVKKTLEVMHEHFYWPSMKHDAQYVCDKCIPCKQAKSKVMPLGFYTPLHVPNHPWTDVSMDIVLGLPQSQGGKEYLFLLIGLVKWRISLCVPKSMMQRILLIFSLKK